MMSQKNCNEEKGFSDITSKVVVVAVKASKKISRTALVWTLTHVVQPGDCIKLLVLIPALSSKYAESGQITEKADVYSFGVILLELVTGRKAVDISRPKGQQWLTEWALPLLEKHDIHELVDPSIRNCYVDDEVNRMLLCSALCIRRNPHLRPRMCQDGASDAGR